MLLVAKLASRHTVVDHFVEDGTQGLHYCRLEPRHDDHPTDPDEAAKLESLHERTRALATRVVEPVTVRAFDWFVGWMGGWLIGWLFRLLVGVLVDAYEV